MSDKLRVYVYTNIPSEPRYYPVPDLRTAFILIDGISKELLLCDRDVASSIVGLHKWYDDIDGDENAEWGEWEDEDGYTIDAYELDDNLNVINPDGSTSWWI